MTETIKQADGNLNNLSLQPTDVRLRLWPAVAIVVALWGTRIWAWTGETTPDKFFFGLLVMPAAVTILLHLWWLFGSRLRWSESLRGFCTFIVVAVTTVFVAGKSFPPMGLILFVLPIVTTVWIVWLLVTQRLSKSVRLSGVLAIFVMAGVVSSLLRGEGMDGDFHTKFNWRWLPTSEARLLSELKLIPSLPASESSSVADLTLREGDWPGFRGPQRDGRLTGVSMRPNWYQNPPRQLWRHRIGPGWSSFAVISDRLFTQEQRGSDEFVVCYDTETGLEVWSHHDTTRFEEMAAGAGPRGTPTFHEGRIFALGANGNLNCLNAATGKPYWSVNIVADSHAAIPQWGFSSSPLVSHGLVSVFTGGPDGKSVVAYKIESGMLAWASGTGSKSYCSTQLATLDGVEQLLIATDAGLTAFEPEQGTVLWEHRWAVDQARVVQPTILSETDLLLGTGMSGGTRRLRIQRDGDHQWQIKELWTSKAIKPYYNDLVVLDDHLYGFDGGIFMCVDLSDGKMQWRYRGYGSGQVLLLVNNKLMFVMTEQGEVAMVEADPSKHVEIGRVKGIEGKTWNHPVIAHGKLFIRNAEEIACFELPTLNGESDFRPKMN